MYKKIMLMLTAVFASGMFMMATPSTIIASTVHLRVKSFISKDLASYTESSDSLIEKVDTKVNKFLVKHDKSDIVNSSLTSKGASSTSIYYVVTVKYYTDN